MALRTLVAKLVADTGQFQKGMKKAESVLTGFAGKVAALAGGVLSARFLAGAISETITFGDTLAKTADRLGLTTQQLGALRHAGEMAGIGIEGIDTGLEKFVVAIGKASIEGGTAEEVFTRLGLSAREMAAQSPYRSLVQVSDAIRGLANQSEKALAARELFGRSGVKLLNLLGQEGAGLRDASKAIGLLNTEMARTDAAKLELLDDRFDELKAAFQGLKIALTSEFAASINSAIGNFVAWATEGHRAANFIRLSIQTMGEVAVNTAAAFQAAWTISMETVSNLIRNAIKLWAQAIGGLQRGREGLLSGVKVGLGLLGPKGAFLAGKLPKSDSLAGSTDQLLADDMRNRVAVGRAKITRAWEQLLSGEAAASFRDRLAKMTESFHAAAMATAALADKEIDLGDSIGKSGELFKPADPRSFREISLSRTAIGGLSGKSDTTSEVQKSNKHLHNIFNELRKVNFRGQQATFS